MGNLEVEINTGLPYEIKSFYERMSTDHDAALAELPELFTNDIHFINPVVDEKGLDKFRAQWVKAFKSYKVFECHDIIATGDDDYFTLTYTMSIKFALGPTFKTIIATDFRGRDGKVYFCRDYFDVVGSLVKPFPPLAWLYKKVFGLVVV